MASTNDEYESVARLIDQADAASERLGEFLDHDADGVEGLALLEEAAENARRWLRARRDTGDDRLQD